MTSEKQIHANRENSKKSTGPKTEAGKNRSKLNAVRHGLTGQVTIMTEEDRIAGEAFIIQIVENFHPGTAAERQLAHVFATAQWRINRAAALEDGLFALGLAEDKVLAHLSVERPEVHAALSNAATFREQSRDFDKLSLYTQRLINQSEKILKQIKQLQSHRYANEAIAIRLAADLYQFHEDNHLPFDPRENGFILTIDEIRSHIRREKLLHLSYGATTEVFLRRKDAQDPDKSIK